MRTKFIWYAIRNKFSNREKSSPSIINGLDVIRMWRRVRKIKLENQRTWRKDIPKIVIKWCSSKQCVIDEKTT